MILEVGRRPLAAAEVTHLLSSGVERWIDMEKSVTADLGDLFRRPRSARTRHGWPLSSPAEVRRSGRSPRVLAVVDVVALLLSFVVFGRSAWLALAYVAGCELTLVLAREYRPRLDLDFLDALPRLAGLLAVPFSLFVVVGVVVDAPRELMAEGVVAIAALLVGRSVSFAWIRRQRRRRKVASDVVIVGAGRVGCELYRLLNDHPEYGLRPIGIVDDVPAEPGVPVIGPLADLGAVLDDADPSHVIVAFGPTAEPLLIELLRSPVLDSREIYVVPRFFDLGLAPRGPDIDSVWGIPLYRLYGAARRSTLWPAKRFVDVAVAVPLLIMTAPLFAVLAVAVRLSSPGPALFRQNRVGERGRTFQLLKLRTLPVDYVDCKANASDDEYRLPIARFLRRTSLDELPQLVNVLRGDMTLVGPRPERPYLVEQLNSEVYGYRDRHRLPMGLTGLAQVKGLRGDSPLEERVRFDNHYIGHWTLWGDLAILVRTVGAVVRTATRRSSVKGNVPAAEPPPSPVEITSPAWGDAPG